MLFAPREPDSRLDWLAKHLPRIPNLIKRIWNLLGLSWIFVLLCDLLLALAGISKVEDLTNTRWDAVAAFLLYMKGSSEPGQTGLDDMAEFAKFQTYLRDAHLQNALKELARTRDEQEKWKGEIENKALALIGFTALAGAFILGLGQLVLNDKPNVSTLLSWLWPLYAGIGLSFLITITLAIHVPQVGEDKYERPLPSLWWDVNGKTTDDVGIAQARAILSSQIVNRALINARAQYLIAAQTWFRNTIVLFFLLAVTLGSLMAENSGHDTGATATVTATLTATLTASVTASATQTPTPNLTPTRTVSPISLPTPTT